MELSGNNFHAALASRKVLVAGILLAALTTLVISLLYFYRLQSEYNDRLDSILAGLIPQLEEELGKDDPQEVESIASLILLQAGVQAVSIMNDGQEYLTLGASKVLGNENLLRRFPLHLHADDRVVENGELILAGDRSVLVVNTLRIALVMAFVQTFLMVSLVMFAGKRIRQLAAEEEAARARRSSEGDELSHAVTALNEKLHQHQAYMQDVVAERDRRISVLEHHNEELQRFSYSVSHDLKSPLVTITGFLDLLQKDIADGNASLVERDLMRMTEAADNMKGLLDDLQKMARFSQPRSVTAHVSFSHVLSNVLNVFSARIEDSKAQVVVDNTLPQVLVDESGLREVLTNLLDNALRYRSRTDTPCINIGCSSVYDRGPTLRGDFYMRDNGIGIEPEYQDRVFRLFERLHSDGQGSGIGLALVKRIVEGYGGTIRIESGGQGRGCTVIFDLPLEQPA